MSYVDKKELLYFIGFVTFGEDSSVTVVTNWLTNFLIS
jgi:hypothetical protein